MELADRPLLRKSAKLVGPTGTVIEELGQGEFSLKLGKVTVDVEAVVADIDDDGLLGKDVLQNGSGGPADLLLSKGVLQVKDQEVPIIQVGLERKVRKVTVSDHAIIPAKTEAILDVYVEKYEHDEFSAEADWLIEPSENFSETYPLRMASTRIDINQSSTCKVRILNPYSTDVSIEQGAIIGKAEPMVARKSEVENIHRVRSVRLLREGVAQIQDKIPDSVAVQTDTKPMVPGLQTNSQETMSCDGNDVGRTSLPKLQIKVEDASTTCIKQPPRRVSFKKLKITHSWLPMEQEIQMPTNLLLGGTRSQPERIKSYSEEVDLRQPAMQHTPEVTRGCLSTAVKRSKDHYDVKWPVNSYALDDVVWYLNEKHANGRTPKLLATYLGPVPIKRKVTAVDYIIQLDESGRELLIHHDKLKPYEDESVQRWVKKGLKRLRRN